MCMQPSALRDRPGTEPALRGLPLNQRQTRTEQWPMRARNEHAPCTTARTTRQGGTNFTRILQTRKRKPRARKSSEVLQ